MTKQEEIREEAIDVMADRIEQGGEYTARGAWLLAQSLYDDYLLPSLHKQGVVIKVERELPDNEAWHKVEREFEAYCAGKNELIWAGYVAVEPIKEVDNDQADKD